MLVLLLDMGEAYVFCLSSKGRLHRVSGSEMLAALMENKFDGIAIAYSQRTIMICIERILSALIMGREAYISVCRRAYCPHS
jgi:hypothetical protein